jgi:hypothetical protein
MASVRHLGLFPWCFDLATSTFNSDELLEYAVPMWWRVKEWTLESTVTILTNSDPPGSTTYSSTNMLKITDLPINIATENTFEKETDLVCAGVLPLSFLRRPNDWQFNSVDVLSTGDAGWFNYGQLRIGTSFDFALPTGSDTTGVAVADGHFAIESGYDGPTLGLIECVFCGLSFSKEMKRQPIYLDPDGGPGSLAEVTSCDFVLSATEYWPYDPGDGKGPIYDSATGAQLRGFPI